MPWRMILLLSLVGGPLWAQGRKPEKEKPKRESSSHSLHDAKEGANDALNNVDRGVHQAGSAAKEGAEDALNAVDRGVHKAIGSTQKK